jgi:hypothetical protein
MFFFLVLLHAQKFPGSSHYKEYYVFFFSFETGIPYVAQAVLELLGLTDPLASASEVAGTIDMYH